MHDWHHSRRICESVRVPVLLAGGLSPDNARAAAEQVRPAGLDVCSGLRTEGRLDAGIGYMSGFIPLPSILELFASTDGILVPGGFGSRGIEGKVKAIEYARTRKQFGKAISEFGMIRHKLGNMAIKIFAVESMAYRTSGMVDAFVSTMDKSSAGYDQHVQKALEEYAIECSRNFWSSRAGKSVRECPPRDSSRASPANSSAMIMA